MQSRKPSKKTRKAGEETVAAAPENSTTAPEANTKSRASKSSEAKGKTGGTGRAKHRNASMAEHAVDSPVIDPVGVMTSSADPFEGSPVPVETSIPREIAHEHIAKLAHSYWIARDHAHGFAEEDWHRAERELKSKR